MAAGVERGGVRSLHASPQELLALHGGGGLWPAREAVGPSGLTQPLCFSLPHCKSGSAGLVSFAGCCLDVDT